MRAAEHLKTSETMIKDLDSQVSRGARNEYVQSMVALITVHQKQAELLLMEAQK